VVRDTRSLGSSTLFLCLLICWGLGFDEGGIGHTCWPLGALLLPLWPQPQTFQRAHLFAA
jgi:hypothetical protein